MTKGYFIYKSDKTICGGEFLGVDTHILMFGFAQGREGPGLKYKYPSGFY